MAIILPGVDQYIAGGIQKLGDTISLFTETDRKTQRAIRNKLIENPDMIQQFADLEKRAPGTLQKLGFGPVSDFVTKHPESLGQQRERRLGQKALDIEERQLDLTEAEQGFQAFKNQMMKDIIAKNPELSEEQANAAFEQFVGIPSQSQLSQELLAGERAKRDLDRLKAGTGISSNVFSLAQQFVNGEANQGELEYVVADPNLVFQFKEAVNIIAMREQLEIQAMRAAATSNIPASIMQDVIGFRTALGNISIAREAVQSHPESFGWTKRRRGILGEITQNMDPEGAEHRAKVEAAVSEIRRNFLGTQMPAAELANAVALYPKQEDPPEVILHKLNRLEEMANGKLGVISNIYGPIGSMYNQNTGEVLPTSSERSNIEEFSLPSSFSNYDLAPDFTQDDFLRLFDTMIQRGMTFEEAQDDLVNKFKILIPKSSGAGRTF